MKTHYEPNNVWVETPEPRYKHDLHGGEGLFVFTNEQPGVTTEDVWVVRDALGVRIVRRWSDRECDVETVSADWYVERCIEVLDHWRWTIDQIIALINGGEPC